MKRRIVQAISAIAGNSYFEGFARKRIYTGQLKKICFPGLNCYSCPSAYTACPIGALQAVALEAKLKISLYVFGFLMLIGTLVGRMVCGWICPFGLFQELLYKIPSLKIKIHKSLRFVKYGILVVFIVLIPLFIADTKYASPLFCELLCPAGTLEAGIPLVAMREELREIVGWLFGWKLFVLLVTIIFAVLSRRPFCRIMCPLGAFYALFNKISIYKMAVEESKCTKCNNCQNVCPVDHRIYEDANSPECIRCGDCAKRCPQKAIQRGSG